MPIVGRIKKVVEMGKIKTENMDDEKEFLGGLTQKEFYERLHFQRTHLDGLQRFHKKG